MTLARQARASELRVCVAHFFNHQTHHRGRVRALPSRRREDYGVTDLVWMPELQPRPWPRVATRTHRRAGSI